MKKYVAVVVVIIFASIFLYSISRNATPSSSLFYVKRVAENLILVTKFSPEGRADYYSHLLDVRLRELQQLYEQKEFDLIISASLRYSTVAGRLAETIKAAQLAEESLQTKEQFTRHKQELQTMADRYAEKDDRWKFIIDAKNYLDIYEKELP